MPEFYEPLLDFSVPEHQNIMGGKASDAPLKR